MAQPLHVPPRPAESARLRNRCGNVESDLNYDQEKSWKFLDDLYCNEKNKNLIIFPN